MRSPFVASVACIVLAAACSAPSGGTTTGSASGSARSAASAVASASATATVSAAPGSSASAAGAEASASAASAPEPPKVGQSEVEGLTAPYYRVEPRLTKQGLVEAAERVAQGSAKGKAAFVLVDAEDRVTDYIKFASGPGLKGDPMPADLQTWADAHVVANAVNLSVRPGFAVYAGRTAKEKLGEVATAPAP